jgi:hypothetical protein
MYVNTYITWKEQFSYIKLFLKLPPTTPWQDSISRPLAAIFSVAGGDHAARVR